MVPVTDRFPAAGSVMLLMDTPPEAWMRMRSEPFVHSLIGLAPAWRILNPPVKPLSDWITVELGNAELAAE